MVVKVWLSEVTADDGIDFQLADDATVHDLLKVLNLLRPGEVVVILNAKIRRPGDPLHNGDRVTILPVVEGG